MIELLYEQMGVLVSAACAIMIGLLWMNGCANLCSSTSVSGNIPWQKSQRLWQRAIWGIIYMALFSDTESCLGAFTK